MIRCFCFSNNQDSICNYNAKNIEKVCKLVFEKELHSSAEINIILTNDKYLKSLKKIFFNLNEYTDVIAFNLEDKADCIDGEIYISTDRVIENARTYNKSIQDEFKRIIIHGLLHLLGYDDKTEIEKEKMSNLEDYYITETKKISII